jgi:hypothetical protein
VVVFPIVVQRVAHGSELMLRDVHGHCRIDKHVGALRMTNATAWRNAFRAVR